MLLQTRPDLALIAVVGLLVVIVFLVKMAIDVGNTQDVDQARRGIIGIVVAVVLMAYTLPDAISSLSEESCWLTIEDDQTYTVSSGESEEYCGIRCDGQLNLNGHVELSH